MAHSQVEFNNAYRSALRGEGPPKNPTPSEQQGRDAANKAKG